ncbi:Transcription factor [Quillaja saponaria]|uniref:Transcription factor n=1 Tax=Quillaja saponaria TaxID=32244 RepID=A0AAD7LIU3_QUISA|nr:Transcription factor [Quillaja saponaria]
MANRPSNLQQSFHAFLEQWLFRQQTFLRQLLRLVISPADEANKFEQQRILIDQVLSHYQLYFEERSRIANEDIFLLFSPPWLSSYEQAMLWIAGSKPCLAFQFVDRAIEDLTAEQKQRMERVKVETRREERELTETMARVQETVAAPPMLGLARRAGRLMGGEISTMDTAIEAMKRAMLDVFESAESLRVTTVKKVLEILSQNQTIYFLAVAAEFQLHVRRLGMERDTERATRTRTTV